MNGTWHVEGETLVFVVPGEYGTSIATQKLSTTSGETLRIIVALREAEERARAAAKIHFERK